MVLSGSKIQRNRVKSVNTGTKVALSVASVAFSLGLGFIQPANAVQASDIQPEVVSNVWEENNAEYASVSLNGKDLLTYKANVDNHVAEEKAEDLADKIKDLMNEDKFDASKLLPAKDGDMAVVKLDGTTVLKFDVSDLPTGVYILSIETNTGEYERKKLIVRR